MALAFVDKALEDIEFLGKDLAFVHNPVKELQTGLRYLRTFLLCARKWHNDKPSESDAYTSRSSISSSCCLGSFLTRLEYALIENGKDFHNLCLREEEICDSKHLGFYLYTGVFRLTECIYSYSQEINESYITLSDCCTLQSRDHSMEFIDSLLVNMADIRDDFFYKGLDPIGELKEKLVFFKNFIRFAELRGFEPWQLQDLFTHLQVLALSAARLCHEWTFLSYNYDIELCDEFQLRFSQLLQKIKLVDPETCKTYVHVLRVSNLPGSLQVLTQETDKHVLGEFVDSLLYNIGEALAYGDSYVVSLQDQLPILYEGLRFLRTILTEHLKKINELHEKVKDLIGAAVNEAAMVVCLLLVHELKEGLAKEMNFALSNLLEKIKLIKIVTSTCIYSRTDELGFLDFFLENLKELPTCKVDSVVLAEDQIQRVKEDLVSLRPLLESILDQHNHDGKLQSLRSHIVKVAYKTQFVILSLVVGDIPDCTPLLFKPITEEINLIKMEGLKILDKHHSFDARNATKTSNPLPSQGSTPAINKIMVTLDDEENTIIEQLVRGSKQLDIISVVGMPGLGKTTLARRVYDNPSVRDFFHMRAWCVVSQVYKKKDLLLQILGCIISDEYFKKNEKLEGHELEEKLKKCLLRRRYLVVLDDVWDIEIWTGLEGSFPKDFNSSRILLTSRHPDLAKKINPNRGPHPLRHLTDDESWDLLQKKLYWKNGYSVDLGRKIAKNCKGLPLTIVIISGVLANVEPDDWEEIAGRLSSSALSVTDHCMHTLELSYKQLPDYLKSCFLYFGSFPEDAEIDFKFLSWLWIAEGFVKECESKSLEDLANDYMNDLIGRGLIMVSEERSIGGVKTCRFHDLLHEFCAVKAKKEKFMSILNGRDELFTIHGQRDTQRLCVHSNQEHFEKSRLFCPNVRSLLHFGDKDNPHCYHISFIFHLFKHLKVLNLLYIDLGSTFPSEIALLAELRFLTVRGRFDFIPSVVADLSDLETLLVYTYGVKVLLPDTIWNMLKLRVLYLSSCGFLDSGVAKDSLKRSSGLLNLDAFRKLELSFGQSMENIMRKLPNIRKLKCKLFESGESNADRNRIVAMDFLIRLESLNLKLPEVPKYHVSFCLPWNLKRLTLSRFHSSIIPRRGELPNLAVLKLSEIGFDGDIWDMKEKWEFPKLKFLELRSLRIVRWTDSEGDDHFPCLQKLVFWGCLKLEEVPSCLEDITNLQMIEVHKCPKSVANLLLKIKEEQKNNWGNEDLQVLTSKILE
ncbi:hypothetical protein ACH5RR_009563 [Cinchona calisaya]|uniref:Late blight resistance protein homolog R1A-3 n=1 Tax=Cinchona calisaya TaxID=153742 RepID=A0ABD3AEM2_9GENT